MLFFSSLTLTAASLLFSMASAIPMKRELPSSPGGQVEFATEVFAGISTFAHLPYARCMTDPSMQYDLAVVGVPFDTATSYRPGARFGPSGIREGSRRTVVAGSYNAPLKTDPYKSGATLLDCGDIPVTPFDNIKAIDQIYEGYLELLDRKTPKGNIPKLLTLGGDHTIVLPILRSLHKVHGKPVSVIHFDSHLDTWKPFQFEGYEPNLNHGDYFYFAAKEGLLAKEANIHIGIRSKLYSPNDYIDDANLGFEVVEAREIDDIGTKGIIKRIKEAVGDNLVYLSIDIDVLDPSFAPATGTPETGGFSTRELRRIIQGLEGLNFVGADVVEVAPAYDTNAQLTAMAAADVMYDIMSIMVKHNIK